MDSIDDQVNKLLKEGKKLEAIKVCKENFNIEFADAKAYVEELIVNLETVDNSPKKTTEDKKIDSQSMPEGKSANPDSPENIYSEFVSENTSKKPKGMFRDMEAFEGRIRRTEYALSLMLAVGVSVILYIVYFAQIMEQGDIEVPTWMYFVSLIISFGMLSQGSRRCHDLGNSGWMQLVPFYFLWMIFQEGQPGVNEYGESPK